MLAEMKCDRMEACRIIDMRQYGDIGIQKAVLRFVKGIRGKRLSPVSKKQIHAWLFNTPAEAVDDAIAALVFQGKVTAASRGFNRSGRNNATRQHVYEAIDDTDA